MQKQGIEIQTGELVLAQSQPDGETYVLSVQGICGPPHHTDWQDAITQQPRAGWAWQDWQFETADEADAPVGGWRVLATERGEINADEVLAAFSINWEPKQDDQDDRGEDDASPAWERDETGRWHPTEFNSDGSPSVLGDVSGYYAPCNQRGRYSGFVWLVDSPTAAETALNACTAVESYRRGAVLTGAAQARYLAAFGEDDETLVETSPSDMGVWVSFARNAADVRQTIEQQERKIARDLTAQDRPIPATYQTNGAQ